MTITNTKSEDFQKYYVKVDNEVGSNRFQIVLKSASIPITPTIVSILPRINDIEVGWIPMFNGGQNQSFILEYRKRLDVAWKNITVDSDTYKEQQISHIYGLQPGTEYEIRMYAFNTIGKSVVTKIVFAKTEKSTDLILLYAILGLVTIVSITIFAGKIMYKWINKDLVEFLNQRWKG